MSNAELIERSKRAFQRRGLIDVPELIDALELADKRIAELEADLNEWKRCRDAVLRDLTSAQYKLAVAWEALKILTDLCDTHCKWDRRFDDALDSADEALAQIGGEDAGN